jgi:hypothetical protein
MIYNLTEEQKDAILGWQQHQQKVISILRDHDMDEDEVLAAADKIMELFAPTAPTITSPRGD